MKYKVEKYHRYSSNEDIIADLRRVAKHFGKDTLTREEYRQCGKYGSTTVYRHFGSWNKALAIAGLGVTHCGTFLHDSCKSEDDFLKDLNQVALMLKSDSVTFGEYKRYGKYDVSQMLRFYHSWNTILKKAGLAPTKFRIGAEKSITETELLEEILRVWNNIGRQPKTTDFHSGLFKYSLNTYCRRFGSWFGSLMAFEKWINEGVIDETEILEMDELKDMPYKDGRSRNIPMALRLQVMDRDNYMCANCHASRQTDPTLVFHIHHVVPWSNGGKTELDNLQLLCAKCNLEKGNKK